MRFSLVSVFITNNVVHYAVHVNKYLHLYFVMHYNGIMKAKTETLQIRLTPDEKDGFEQASDIAGIPLSSWVRERLRMAAIRDLESAGQQIPFVKPFVIKGIK